MTNTSATPLISTLSLKPQERALGRLVKLTSPQESDVIKDLTGDAFWEYFSNEPTPKEETPTSRQINRRLLDWAKESPAWESSRSGAKGSILLSSLSSRLLAENLTTDEAINEALKKQEEANKEEEKRQEKEQEAQEAQDKADKAQKEANQPGASQDQKQAAADAQAAANKAQAQAQAAQAAAAAAQAQAEAAAQKVTGGGHEAIRAAAVQQAKEKTEETKKTLQGWGLDPYANDPVEIEKINQAIAQNTPISKMIAELAGRLHGIAANVRAKKVQFSSSLVKDGYTRKLVNVFPFERSALGPNAHPIQRAIKTAEWADHGLIGMIEGVEAEKRGSLIIAVDRSSSMIMNGTEPLVNARALAFGIAEEALENGQEFTVFHFNASDTDFPSFTSQESKVNLINWCNVNCGGGTVFSYALDHCLDILRDQEDEAENADIVFITDGESNCNPVTLKRYVDFSKEFGTRLIILKVGSGKWSNLDEYANAVVASSGWNNIDLLTEQVSEALNARETE